jgi:hypothetical protein
LALACRDINCTTEPVDTPCARPKLSFGTGYAGSSIIDNGGSSFTITAIPEPSTILAALGLIGLMLWPARRRFTRQSEGSRNS